MMKLLVVGVASATAAAAVSSTVTPDCAKTGNAVATTVNSNADSISCMKVIDPTTTLTLLSQMTVAQIQSMTSAPSNNPVCISWMKQVHDAYAAIKPPCDYGNFGMASVFNTANVDQNLTSYILSLHRMLNPFEVTPAPINSKPINPKIGLNQTSSGPTTTVVPTTMPPTPTNSALVRSLCSLVVVIAVVLTL
ncbi:hypothetical protein AeNC1_007187 [Aphanomyces euteiches]|nr:hypothetical protein AeNC1_007187 [Aphanomyces euteiches]